MCCHFFDAVWFAQVPEHRVVALCDDAREGIEEFEKILPAFNYALVMERDVVVGFFVTYPEKACFEVIEIAPDVTVVGPESGQINVRKEEDATTYAKATMTTGVSREMNWFDRGSAKRG